MKSHSRQLKVFPQSNGPQQRWSMSVYLQAPRLRDRPGIKMYVEANLRVLNKSYPKNYKKNTVSGWLSAKYYECCQPVFMPWEDLKKGFINKKELEFEVEILNLSKAEGNILFS
ncbi:hypothetical protein EUGRSUZ_L00337 [Eucalyptus grandis]|uniref:Uncharacterized protein n=2 Tax=Eucalyptus grandis TaxID=71139 RepID=A0ACC3L5W4_EUCGR|nr:hypothetical protein EUGRSUZ_L00337 [Eucalyptus grandis]